MVRPQLRSMSGRIVYAWLMSFWNTVKCENIDVCTFLCIVLTCGIRERREPESIHDVFIHIYVYIHGCVDIGVVYRSMVNLSSPNAGDPCVCGKTNKSRGFRRPHGDCAPLLPSICCGGGSITFPDRSPGGREHSGHTFSVKN